MTPRARASGSEVRSAANRVETKTKDSTHALRVPVLATAFLALVLRVVYLIEARENPFWRHLGLDMQVYDQWARSMLDGGGIAGGTGGGPFTQAPLFPMLLAATYGLLGPDPVRALWAHLLPQTLAVALTAFAAGRWKGLRAAWIAGGLLAVAKPVLFYTGVLLPPSWVLCLSAAFLAFANEARFAGGAGLLAGLLAVAQPTAFPLTWPRLSGWTRERRWIPLAFAALPLVATLLWNGMRGDTWRFVSVNTGLNLYVGNGPEANGGYVRPPGVREDQDLIGIEAAREAVRAAHGEAAVRTFGPAEADAYWTQAALTEMARDPLRAIGLFARKFWFVFGQYELQQVESLPFESRWSLLLRSPLPGMAVLLAGAVAGLLALGWQDRRAREVALGIACCAIAIGVFFVTARFRAPLYPWMALLAGAGLSAFWNELARRELPAARAPYIRRVRIGAGVALVVSLSQLIFVGKRANEGQFLYRVGVIEERAGNTDAAIAAYREAVEVDPTLARPEVNLGALLARSGRIEEAAPHLERGWSLDPRSARGALNLGQLEQVRGRGDRALALYREAVVLDPELIGAWESLGSLAYDRGLVVEAEAAFATVARMAPPDSPPHVRARTLLALWQDRSTLNPGWREHRALRGADLALWQGDIARAQSLYDSLAGDSVVGEAARCVRARLRTAR